MKSKISRAELKNKWAFIYTIKKFRLTKEDLRSSHCPELPGGDLYAL